MSQRNTITYALPSVRAASVILVDVYRLNYNHVSTITYTIRRHVSHSIDFLHPNDSQIVVRMSAKNKKNKKDNLQHRNAGGGSQMAASADAWTTKPASVVERKVPVEKKQHSQLKQFDDIRKKHIEAAKLHADSYESSSEEELESDALLESVFKGYGGDKKQLQKTQEFLENVFQSGTATCLICIATVKRTDYIWSCENCFSFFHLNCTQRWARDSTSLQRMQQEHEIAGYYNNQGDYIVKQKKAIKWSCPKCRSDYAPSEIPDQYYCFCKQEINPPNIIWHVPHSCGNMCRKDLQCGHQCVLLCHPGPCPPCAQMITISCECGQSPPRTVRCIQKLWKCANKCSRMLSCGIHVCSQPCHASNKCPPCTKKSMQSCVCGNRQQERNCDSLTWNCDKLCNKSFDCGRHKCKVKCHDGSCGPCPNGLPRSCPCGKEESQAPCTEDIGPCGNTCLKTLECGNHICAERCHRGDCGQCLEIVEKRCRCGQHSKEFPCSKPYLCEAKCKRIRDCNKHPCNRKCCDGQCPPCDKICGKMLSCQKHKCTSPCHQGQCYPCELKAQVKCRCSKTAMTVPCGREKKTKAPKCQFPCKIASKCHHTNEHKCHMNDCPTCVQPCLLANDTTGCEHLCTAKCHDAIKVQIVDKNFRPAGPWEIQTEKIEIRKLPHPRCEVKVPVVCLGGHEKILWPCWNSTPSSCQRKCGRKLKCGNHVCQELCHSVEDQSSMTKDKSCDECMEGCQIPRPEGCIHPCSKRCHPSPCEPCNITTKTACHCGLNQVYYKCNEFYSFDVEEAVLEENRQKKLSCGNRCIRNFPCGHRCTNICHSGPCTNAESCRKKVKIYCECKNRKVETSCDKIRSGFELKCDENCEAKLAEAKKLAEDAERVKQEQEDERNRIELEEFEKKFGKKKHKERKRQVAVESDNSYMWKLIFATGAIALVAIIIYFVFLP